MNATDKPHLTVLSGLFSIADDLQPLAEKKNPKFAAIFAFFGGGIALGIYLKSFKDFLIPTGILFVMAIFGVVTYELLLLLAPPVWSTYAFRRVSSSNRKLDERSHEPEIIDAQVVTSPPPVPTVQKNFADSQTTITARLRRLDDLHREGILSTIEHATKRAQILSEL